MPGLVPGRLMRPGVWAVDRSAFVPGSKLHLQDMSGSGLGLRVFGLGSESLRKFWLWS